jgi:hypothetical protein
LSKEERGALRRALATYQDVSARLQEGGGGSVARLRTETELIVLAANVERAMQPLFTEWLALGGVVEQN